MRNFLARYWLPPYITRGLMQGGSQYLAKKFRTVKVHLKAGYELMLYAKQQ